MPVFVNDMTKAILEIEMILSRRAQGLLTTSAAYNEIVCVVYQPLMDKATGIN